MSKPRRNFEQKREQLHGHSTAEILNRRQRHHREQQRAISEDTHAEVEYLDAIFDDASLEAEVIELTKGGYSSGSFDSMRAFGPRGDSQEVLNEIKKVRQLQQEVYHNHLKVELDLNDFVRRKSEHVSKADASAKFAANFRTEFDSKKEAIEEVSENLDRLSKSVERVNSLVGGRSAERGTNKSGRR